MHNSLGIAIVFCVQKSKLQLGAGGQVGWKLLYCLKRLLVFHDELLLSYRTSFLEVHEVHFNSEVFEGKRSEETLIRAGGGNPIHFLIF
jgi:hypothetical protein